jgi:hypothetical protein
VNAPGDKEKETTIKSLQLLLRITGKANQDQAKGQLSDT